MDNENLDVIESSLQVFGSEFISSLLTDDTTCDSLDRLIQAIKSLSKEDRLNVNQTITKMTSTSLFK